MTRIAQAASCPVAMIANRPQGSGCRCGEDRTLHRVAQEFESLLIGQILQSMKLGEISDDANGTNSSMMEIAQEHLARLISQNGGIGVGRFLEQSLNVGGGPSCCAVATSGLPD